jgi:DNA-binding NtrC family response regulator
MDDTSGQILVVDDDLEMRALVKDVLEEEGHHVTTTESGRDALQRLSEGEYAVVLTDLRMQGMQGLELLSSIKETYPDINVILMTAFGSVETAIEAMKQGAYDYLIKPRHGARGSRGAPPSGGPATSAGSAEDVQLPPDSGKEQADAGRL